MAGGGSKEGGEEQVFLFFGGVGRGESCGGTGRENSVPITYLSSSLYFGPVDYFGKLYLFGIL